MAENKPDKFIYDAEVKKYDDERRIIFGWANVAVTKDGEVVVDRQGDIMDLQALEDAAYAFNLYFRGTGVNHSGEAVGKLVESFVVTPEKLSMLGLEKAVINHGWFVGFHIEDEEVWKAVKKKKLKAFSIQGRAYKTEVQENG